MTDLSGTWTGNYAYPGSLSPVPFVAELRDSSGQLSGLTSESGEVFQRVDTAHAISSGTCVGTRVRFTKIYESHEWELDAVNYDGVLDDDGSEITGSWTIAGQGSGPFVMTRPKPAHAALEIERSEAV
jgi:hypothetical protein